MKGVKVAVLMLLISLCVVPMLDLDIEYCTGTLATFRSYLELESFLQYGRYRIPSDQYFMAIT